MILLRWLAFRGICKCSVVLFCVHRRFIVQPNGPEVKAVAVRESPATRGSTMKAFHLKNAVLAAILAVCVMSITTCSGLTDLIEGGDDGETSIPDGILDLADGIFSLIGEIFDGADYPGMTVVTSGNVQTITFDNFTHPDDTSGAKGSGTLTLTRTGTSPLSIRMKGTLTFSGLDYSSASIDGSATWASGVTSPSDGEPASITGTFTVDKTVYDLKAIVDALAERNSGDDGGTTVPTLYPIDPRYRGAHLNSTLKDGIANTTVSFTISADGNTYSMVDGATTCTGTIKWYMDSGWQLLHFNDTAKVNDRWYVVMNYDAVHLLLHIGTPVEEWNFEVVH